MNARAPRPAPPAIPDIATLAGALVYVDIAALAAQAGVPPVSAWRARAGFAINVVDHLKLAAALAGRPCPTLAVQWWLLAAGLRVRRQLDGASHKRAAALSGVPVATFHRAENLRGRPSLSTYLKLAAFAGGGPWHYVTSGPCRGFPGKHAEVLANIADARRAERRP